MTEQEWMQQLAILCLRWPQSADKINDQVADLWFLDLSEFEVEKVEAAITAIYRDGREFAPNGAQIRNKIAELGAADGGWDRAYQLAMEAAQSHGGAEYGGLLWLREQDPVAADVAQGYGWRDFCLSDSTADGTRRAHFRDMYNLRASKAAERERYRGLNAGGLKVIEEANEPRKLGDVIQLDAGEDAA